MSLYEHYLMWGRTYTLYKNVMESHDLPGRGSAKCRVFSAAALVSFALSSVQIILLHDGSLSFPSPCSQHSITARRRLSSDWCCLCISANTPLGISLSPSLLQATPGRNFKMPSTVRGGTEEKEREEGEDRVETDHMLIVHGWSVVLFPSSLLWS